MGTITRSLSNNITTGGVILPAGITNSSVSAVTSFANAANPANLVLLSTQTASASANISFTTGLNSTYDEYIFKFIDIHPATDSANFTFNGSTDGGSNYNVTKTTSFFESFNNEAGTSGTLQYNATRDIAQGTGFQQLVTESSNANDSNCVGTLTLFNPSSTTYVKHFIARTNGMTFGTYSHEGYTAGYFNTTSAINAIRFQYSSGNIDDGIIKLYGVKKS